MRRSSAIKLILNLRKKRKRTVDIPWIFLYIPTEHRDTKGYTKFHRGLVTRMIAYSDPIFILAKTYEFLCYTSTLWSTSIFFLYTFFFYVYICLFFTVNQRRKRRGGDNDDHHLLLGFIVATTTYKIRLNAR